MMTLELELTTEMEREFIRKLNQQLAGAASQITAINAVRVEVLTESEEEARA